MTAKSIGRGFNEGVNKYDKQFGMSSCCLERMVSVGIPRYSSHRKAKREMWETRQTDALAPFSLL